MPNTHSLASAREGVAEFGEPLGHHGAVDPAAPALLRDESGLGEKTEVVTHGRLAPAHRLLEIAAARAAFGLVAVILLAVAAGRAAAVPYAVAGFIAAGYWFTSSTSFANPAVTIARSLTDTFTGIAPASVPGFVMAQIVGALAAVGLVRLLLQQPTPTTHAPTDIASSPRLPGARS